MTEAPHTPPPIDFTEAVTRLLKQYGWYENHTGWNNPPGFSRQSSLRGAILAQLYRDNYIMRHE